MDEKIFGDAPALHPVTHETDLDVTDPPSLPNSRYPRSSRENQMNRFYVKDACEAGDFRAVLVQGEKQPQRRVVETQPNDPGRVTGPASNPGSSGAGY